MEEGDCYCCGAEGEADSCLRHKDTQLQRLARLTAAGVLLLVSLVLVLLLMVVFGSGSHQAADCQHIMHADGHSSATSAKQQQHKQFENPSALLTAVSNYSTEREYLEWEHKEGNAHLRGGFNYSSGDLVVPRNGHYRVYLQITYESHNNFFCDEDELMLTHWVSRFQDGYTKDVVLLSSVYTVNCNMKMWKKSLYTAAVFQLNASDRLRVSSTHPELIALKEHQVFLGADLEPL